MQLGILFLHLSPPAREPAFGGKMMWRVITVKVNDGGEAWVRRTERPVKTEGNAYGGFWVPFGYRHVFKPWSSTVDDKDISWSVKITFPIPLECDTFYKGFLPCLLLTTLFRCLTVSISVRSNLTLISARTSWFIYKLSPAAQDDQSQNLIPNRLELRTHIWKKIITTISRALFSTTVIQQKKLTKVHRRPHETR